MKINFRKLVIVAAIILVAIALDQWTKIWAENHLATPRYPDHVISITVDSETPVSAQDFIRAKYPDNNDGENSMILANVYRDGNRVMPQDMLAKGDAVELRYVALTVIDGYYDYQYARNPGAAFSFMADQSPEFRAIFFNITGFLAILLILFFIIRTPWKEEKAFIITLATVLGGAGGNIIDRVRLGYVIDFVSWHAEWGGKQHYWPTFNIADVFVTGGVILLCLLMIFGKKKKAVDNEEVGHRCLGGDVPNPDAEKVECKDSAGKVEASEEKAEDPTEVSVSADAGDVYCDDSSAQKSADEANADSGDGKVQEQPVEVVHERTVGITSDSDDDLVQ